MIIPEYFTDGELACRCGCGLLPPRGFVERLYALRMILRFPFPVSSCARCKKHNTAIGGKRGSIHLPAGKRAGVSAEWGGAAVDILLPPSRHALITHGAVSVGFVGIGYSRTFIHLDDAARPGGVESWVY